MEGQVELRNDEFEMAIANAAQGNYKVAAEYLHQHPDRHQELYDRLKAAYGSEEAPKVIAAQMEAEMEKLRAENHQE
jgi:hypothetical protein